MKAKLLSDETDRDIGLHSDTRKHVAGRRVEPGRHVNREDLGTARTRCRDRVDGSHGVIGKHAREARTEHCINDPVSVRSEEHTSELQSLMRLSYAVFCLKKKNKT